MAITEDDLKRKIERAEFHLSKLRDPESQLATESHFASLMTEARSVVQYVAKEKGWPKVRAWEANLPPADRDPWRTVVDLRNDDIHEKPVVPRRVQIGGHWPPGHWPGNHWPDNHWLTVHAQIVAVSGGRAEVLKLAEASLRVVRQLLADFQAL